MRLRSSLALATALAVAACGSSSEPPLEPPEGYPLAFVMDDCAPWDGPATSVFLTDRPIAADGYPAPPFLRISVYRPRGDVVGRSFDLSPETTSTGSVSRCESETSCAQALAAQVRFHDAGPEEPLGGSLSARFPDGRRVSGGFSAATLPRRTLCG